MLQRGIVYKLVRRGLAIESVICYVVQRVELLGVLHEDGLIHNRAQRHIGRLGVHTSRVIHCLYINNLDTLVLIRLVWKYRGRVQDLRDVSSVVG